MFNQAGNIIGMVVSKLDALKIAKSTGDLPQSVNFAIRGEVLRGFLETNRVDYTASRDTGKLENTEIASQRVALLVYPMPPSTQSLLQIRINHWQTTIRRCSPMLVLTREFDGATLVAPIGDIHGRDHDTETDGRPEEARSTTRGIRRQDAARMDG